MDLSHDFTDWSGPDGKVVEVRNTFLHVRASGESKIQAAARSDFVCNYRGYPELVQVPESCVPAAKSRNRRPGKKARARMMRRNSTVQSMNSISSTCTEVSEEPQSKMSDDRMSSKEHGDASVSESTTADDCMSTCSSKASTIASMQTWNCGTAHVDEDEQKAALAPAVGENPVSRTTSASSLPMEGENPTVSRTTSASSLPLQPEQAYLWFAAPFVLGALSVTVLLVLLCCSGAVQLNFGRSYHDHTAQHALETFKEEAEKRLASQELVLKDILSKVQRMQPKEDVPSIGPDLVMKILDLQATLGESEKNRSDPTERCLPVKADSAGDQHPSDEFAHSSISTSSTASATSQTKWAGVKSICVAWLGMVAICSMFQTPRSANMRQTVQRWTVTTDL